MFNHIRKTILNEDLQIIVMISHDSSSIKGDFYEKGIQNFLLKPVSIASIKSMKNFAKPINSYSATH
jgi:hypothetical protein